MNIQIEDAVIPLGDFKSHAATYMDDLAAGGGPLIVTQHGRAACVVMSPALFDEVQRRIEFLQAVSAGLADIKNERIVDDADVDSILDFTSE